MVLLKLRDPINPEFECEVVDSTILKKDLNLVRPCEHYKECYRSCSSLKNRLYQYFVYGELLDCSIYRNFYKTCLNYRKTKDLQLLDEIIEWEKNYFLTRKMTVIQNKVWELRESPPDFERELPEFIQRRHANSSFNK